MPPRARRSLALLAGVAALAGCGGGGHAPKPPERADRPVRPPPGWRTVRNAVAGFTIAAPRRWSARTRRGATLVRSRDKLVAATFAADRGSPGRDTTPADYAEQTLRELPDFEGSVSARARRVRGSLYRSARVDGVGTVGGIRRPQRLTVAAFQRPGAVTYVGVVFHNAGATSAADEAALNRMLRTLRGQPPQRSGRSG
jgi:hypothetical protein